MFLIPPCPIEPAHRSSIVVGHKMRLGAVFVNDVEEAKGEDEAGEAGAGGPVGVDAVGGVVFVGLEVEESACVGRPGGGHAGTGLS